MQMLFPNDNIDNDSLVEESDLEPSRRTTKRANDLDGATWTKNSISIWSDIRKTKEETLLGHPAMFPAQLVERLIASFTRSHENVILDPFSGSGSTLVAAKNMGKQGIGFEINQDYINLAQHRLELPQQIELFGQTEAIPQGSAIIHQLDARYMTQKVEPNSVDLIVTSPPYWDILSQKRTADGKEIRDYGDTIEDLGKIDSYSAFIEELSLVFIEVYKIMRPLKYCMVIVMDLRKKNHFYPFHTDVAAMMQRIGFIYDDLIIWDRRHEYNNLRPLGYPAVFRINKCHEYILIFQKPGE